MKLELEIECKPPYSLQFHVEGNSARRGFWLNERAVVVDLRQQGADQSIRATVVTDAAELPDEDVEWALRHMVAADNDLAEIRATLGRDKRLLKVLDALPGLKPLRV